MLSLYLQAPFAAFRPFTAGSFRHTASFVTPSAAYGLLMNAAGLEMRRDAGRQMTLIGNGLPRFRLALGALQFPFQHSILQQLHNYPVGTQGKDHAADTKETKYNIAPVRRSFLSDIRAYVCVDGDSHFESQVIEGLMGKGSRQYGLLFLGDNNFLIDRFEQVSEILPAYWFVRVLAEDETGLRHDVTRLTISIDRMDMSRTRSALFAALPEPSVEIPDLSWTEVGY